MTDIYLGMAFMSLVGVGLFVLALWLARVLPKRMSYALAAGIVALMFFHSFFLLDNWRLARFLPFSNLVVLGNCIPALTLFLAGFAWRLTPGKWWRRMPLIALFVGIGLWKTYGWILAPAVECGDVWMDDVCLQTCDMSCSAASAATLLKAHGIPATEQEMARLCLTRKMGTPTWGLYRGLKLKTKGTPYRVEFVSGDWREIVRDCKEPVLMLVCLGKKATADPRYAGEWGWLPGVTHATVLFEAYGKNLVRVADPTDGMERWTTRNMDDLSTGVGIRLVRQ